MVNRHGVFYPHHDVLGNVTMLTGKDGRLVERYTYSVTGQVAISDASGKRLAESAVGNRWMFTGREWLPEFALYDYRNRIYSADLGRFLQTDPLRFDAGDSNIYRYADNNYLINTDPLGLQTFYLGSGVSVAVGGGYNTSGGAFLNTNNGPWYDSVGIYSTNGPQIGLDISAGAYGGFAPGPLSNFQGNSTSINSGVSFIDVSGFASTGSNQTLGASIGGSYSGTFASFTVSFTQTRTVTLGDVFRAIRDIWNAFWSAE